MLKSRWAVFVAAGAFVALGIVGVAVVASGGDKGDENDSVAAAAPTSPPPATSTRPPAATPAPQPTQPPAPEPAPTIRTCEAIRASGTYLSESERAFFQANCLNTAAAPPPTNAPPSQQPQGQGPAPAPPPPPPPAPAADEETYRSRAASLVTASYAGVVQFEQSLASDPASVRARVSTLAAGMDNLANGLGAIQPVPDRFRLVHNALITQARAMALVLRDFESVTTEAAFDAWETRYVAAATAINGAFRAYQVVTGIIIPQLRTD